MSILPISEHTFSRCKYNKKINLLANKQKIYNYFLHLLPQTPSSVYNIIGKMNDGAWSFTEQ